MTMEYEQSSGYFHINGVREATGFFGAPGYINNPAAQCEPDKGPLPRGRYIMTDGNGARSRNSIRLIPTKDTDMCG